jgi:hypothetical protein
MQLALGPQGPAGWADTVGIGTLSTVPFVGNVKHVPLPKPKDPTHPTQDDSNALNRFMVVVKIRVQDVLITVAGVHLEWFGDPSDQTQFIQQYFRDEPGPVIIAGDFNLEPTGGTVNAPNASAWDVLLDAGWLSTTGIGTSACLGAAPLLIGEDSGTGWDRQHICKSANSTAFESPESPCKFPCWGYQLDWLIYKPAGRISFIPGSFGTDANPVEPDMCATQACWEAKGTAADPESLAFCSDHSAVCTSHLPTSLVPADHSLSSFH